MGLPGTNWELDFKQCSFRHIMQVLRVCSFSAFSLPPALPPCYCLLAFRRQIRRLTSRISSESYPGAQEYVVRPLCCCAAVQRKGTGPQCAVYFPGSSGSCETVHTSGALCPFVRLVPGARGDISGDRLCPDPVWKSASISLLPRPL